MGVYIKAMRMPENCFECPCCRHDSKNGIQKEQCNLTLDVFNQDYFERLEGRARNCPLVKLPEKHGRLIDAGALKEKFPKDTDWEYPVNTNEYVCEMIDNAKAVIEAEDE